MEKEKQQPLDDHDDEQHDAIDNTTTYPLNDDDQDQQDENITNINDDDDDDNDMDDDKDDDYGDDGGQQTDPPLSKNQQLQISASHPAAESAEEDEEEKKQSEPINIQDEEGLDHSQPPDEEMIPWRPQTSQSTCEFTHTITNYSQKRESGCKKAEYSATTVDEFGNRWRLIVYVNGNGRASNHHLSLFLQVRVCAVAATSPCLASPAYLPLLSLPFLHSPANRSQMLMICLLVGKRQLATF